MAQQQPKKIPCMTFKQTGMCRLGSACRFGHDEKYAYLPPSYTNRAWSNSQASTSGHQANSEYEASEGCNFTLMSYNTLADALAIEHAPELYKAVPSAYLQWQRRKKQLLDEITHWRPDVICLQEIDHPSDFTDALSQLGYDWRHGARSGGRPDGLLTLWQAARFEAVGWECIQMQEHALKDNVALIVVLRACGGPPSSVDAVSAQLGLSFAVANSHLLFNPKRGDIKLGQAGTVLRRMAKMCQELAVKPLAIFTGDFNSTPGSAIYSFVQQGRLECLARDRRMLSGQLEGEQRAAPQNPHWRGSPRQGSAAYHQRRGPPSYSPRSSPPQQQRPGGVPPGFNPVPQRSGGFMPQQLHRPAGQQTTSAAEPSAVNEGDTDSKGPLGQESWPRMPSAKPSSALPLPQKREPPGLQMSADSSCSTVPGGHDIPAKARGVLAGTSGGLTEEQGNAWQHSEEKMNGYTQRSVRQALESSANALGLPGPSKGLQDKGVPIAATSLPPPARFPHCSSFPLMNASLRGSGLEDKYAMENGKQGRLVSTPGQGPMYSYKDKFGQVVWSHVPPTDTDQKRQPFYFSPMCVEEPAPQLLPPSPGIFRTLSFAQQQMRARTWTTENLALATGIRDERGRLQAPQIWFDHAPPEDIWVAQHPLPMQSAYQAVLGSEPAFTSCHGKFIGTVDYLWFTPQAGGMMLRPTKVLMPPPLESLPHGLPSAEWPSDHISLLATFTLSSGHESPPTPPPPPPPPPPPLPS